MDAVAVGNNGVRVLAVVRHSLSRSSKTSGWQRVVYCVGECDKLTLGKVDLTIAFGVFFTECKTPVPQPLSILSRVTSPHGAGVTVVTTLVDGTCFGDDVGLHAVAETGRHEHLDCLDRHLDDVTVRQGLSSYNRVGVGVKDVHTK